MMKRRPISLIALFLIALLWLRFTTTPPVVNAQDQQPSTDSDAVLGKQIWLPFVSNVASDNVGPDGDRDTTQTAEVQAAAAQSSVIVLLKDRADLTNIGGANRRARQRKVINALRAKANAAQKPIMALLRTRTAQGKVSHVTPFWVINGLEITATADVIQELAGRPEVLTITPNATIAAPAAPTGNVAPEPNLTVINAPALWNLGWRGQGIVVASMDSGVDISHPDLSAQWRGGSNSWFDPYGQHPTTPTDLSGHGTWTMGVMVGRDAGGTAIGVAPDAQWIAVKLFNDQGTATVAAIHAGFQWLLDPDDDPNTADAPDVINNSWSFGNPSCNLEFQFDVQAWQAAGIVPLFAAGNYGAGTSTSVSPANYPESFAIGATNNNDAIYAYSSRGPSACGEAATIYPELMAPGVNIKSTDRYGFYTTATGTSLAAPHVAGALALLLSAYPNLTVAEQEAALQNTAVDLGTTGPDNTFGYGRLDILAAYQSLAGGGSSTPTDTPMPPTPTATPVPPTPTDTPVPPTFTPTDTPVPPTPTDTPIPSTFTPTDTPIPPTSTPTDT
ncbi:MAG TPA: S8 family serine peptidase, partial [Caldilineaceae bacterium]|nr:S8 family serine peptidase [Caldilineaceae bacterium]